MTRTSSLGTMVLLFVMTLIISAFALTMLSSASITLPATGATVHQAAAIDWLRPDQVPVPNNLIISAHAAKHHGDTEQIYANLLQGKCAEVAKFCGGSEQEFAYFCVDPVTGIVGAILQIGDEITTGYYEKPGSEYWVKRVPRERWEVCK